MLVPKIVEGFVFLLTLGAGLFALFILVDLFRWRSKQWGPAYKGGLGQWSWAAHRITGLGVLAFLVGHIVDTFMVGFGPEYYNETIKLYQYWWFKPLEVVLIGATIYHGFNGLRIIAFDFWPHLATRQKSFAVAQLALTLGCFAPVAFFMLRSAYHSSPFA
jgi:succinate dehydrogenase / fumarate reductase, cytochrome b subunit